VAVLLDFARIEPNRFRCNGDSGRFGDVAKLLAELDDSVNVGGNTFSVATPTHLD
jgi:hypothetical protein